MVNYKEILRLSHEGYSQRQIESSVHCSRHTVRDTLAAAERSGMKMSTQVQSNLPSIFGEKVSGENHFSKGFLLTD